VILIIAYGNSLRRDDGAGLILGEMLEDVLLGRGLEVARLAVHQLTPDVALSVAAEDVRAVVFVDTRVVGPGEEHLELQLCPLTPGQSSPSLGHQVGASTIMSYARLLYGKTPSAWLLTVPGIDFDHGEGLSQPTLEVLSTLPSLLEQLPLRWPLSDA
jgi:hydrogenase maturation protease